MALKKLDSFSWKALIGKSMVHVGISNIAPLWQNFDSLNFSIKYKLMSAKASFLSNFQILPSIQKFFYLILTDTVWNGSRCIESIWEMMMLNKFVNWHLTFNYIWEMMMFTLDTTTLSCERVLHTNFRQVLKLPFVWFLKLIQHRCHDIVS